MSTTPSTIPDWLTGRVPASMITNGETLADELVEIGERLTPLMAQLKALVEFRDRVIALPLADEGEPCTVDGREASTTWDSNDIVLDSFDVFDAAFPAFAAVDHIGSMIDEYENLFGLRWRVADTDRKPYEPPRIVDAGSFRSERGTVDDDE